MLSFRSTLESIELKEVGVVKVLCENWFLIIVKKILCHAHKTGSLEPLRGSVENFRQAPLSFLNCLFSNREGLGTSL